MSPPEVLLPRLFGEAAARSIMARNLLVPVLGQILDKAVVVFRSAASAAAALRAPPPEGPFGPYGEAVPPLDLRPGISYLIPSFIKVALKFEPTSAAAGEAGSIWLPLVRTSHHASSARTGDRLADSVSIRMVLVGNRRQEARQGVQRARDREYLGEPPEPEPPTVTTTRFVPSNESLLRGPRWGPDGHMRIDGYQVTEWRTATAMGSRTEYASRRVDEAAPIPAGRN